MPLASQAVKLLSLWYSTQQLSRQCALRAAVLKCVVHIQPVTLVP